MSRNDCVYELCDCVNAGAALRQAIHQRDEEQLNNRYETPMNSMWSDILDCVVHYVEELDMTVEELEDGINQQVKNWSRNK